MNLLEIKNNLVKLSYSEDETPVLGQFIVLAGANQSYVAQFVNLKADNINRFAIAKLILTFTPDGVVDNYDGSMPSTSSEISSLPPNEILHLLPMETPIKIGNLAQSENMLNLDISVFERNLTVFTQKEAHKTTFISNCVRQLFQMKEKSVIIDNCNMYDDYEKIKLGVDYKLPLNSKMIDYIFEYDLADVDNNTKAVIQDIFYAVQQYINSLDFQFLPIDNFVDVVTNQYKELQMPELALLKNKLLKYKDANIFANTKDEVIALKAKIEEKNCVIIDIKDINETLQKEVLSLIHSTLDTIDKYIYFFVPLNDENSDKKLLKQIINHNHIFTTLFVSNSYKYAKELKEHAQNMIIFAPENVNNDFANYSSFLSKLNSNDCIVCGKLTQDIPFIVTLNNIETDLTLEDVLGDKYQFIPAIDNTQMVEVDSFGNQTPVNFSTQLSEPEPLNITAAMETNTTSLEPTPLEEEIPEEEIQEDNSFHEESEQNIIAPVSNILEDSTISEEKDDIQADSISPTTEIPDVLEPLPNDIEMPNPSDIQEDNSDENDSLEELSEEDLDFIDTNQAQSNDDFDEIVEDELISEEGFDNNEYNEEQTPVVPIYPAEDTPSGTDGGSYNQGDTVTHPRYGRGVVEKIIKYGNKTLCSISFDNVGRRLLDPTISELTKLD